MTELGRRTLDCFIPLCSAASIRAALATPGKLLQLRKRLSVDACHETLHSQRRLWSSFAGEYPHAQVEGIDVVAM